ncbi:aspartate aminotransferase family protein [Rhodococcus jostii]|uniref:Aminotransferase class III-fold pyridoxal phosphate-dependent enzyme n=1 Tax=Rhodococcus jostii TaxID=132919 RepID=A0ABU4CTS5_RHOJO|nr:aminotransferase class III-fold pyridoxal phosphate-dependent enzyme [Rhodococcus jostii]MDV6286971.1 aminotransferase class III-fold pyridoxal phosphate-dependent enzyme [Rhodococcus jostii]
MTALTETTPSTTASWELISRAHRVMPGGLLGSYAMPSAVETVISHGDGSRIFDVDGKSYIDYILGSGPMIVGHCHPRVVAALAKQASRGTQFYTLSDTAIEFAERLVDSIPCAEHVKLTSSGAESTFYAMRVSRAATGRDKILKFKGAYHGHHDYAMTGSGMSTAGTPSAIDQTLLTATYNDIEGTVATIEANASELAAVIVEPIQRSTPPRPGFLEALREVTTRHGIVLIFDEMVTGFRVHLEGGQGLYGITPDLATYGKAIGGGLALAALAGRADLMDHLSPRRQDKSGYVYMSGTLNGNPLAAAAGIATLDVLQEPGAFTRLEDISQRLRTGLERVLGDAGVTAQVLGQGAMAAVLLAEGDPHDPLTAAASDPALRAKLDAEMIGRGILVNLPAKFYVSTAHNENDIDETLTAFAESIASATK